MENKKKMGLGVSIIICCYNSSSRISLTLEHLARQVVDSSVNREVVIVDNNCIDETILLAQKLWAEYNAPMPLIIVKEKKPGLSYARKKGLESVQYDTIIFCDDDNWLSPNYVQTVVELMNSNSQIGIIGGLGVPEWEITPPKWLLPYSGCYATGPQSCVNGEVDFSHHVYGAGMAIRRAAVDELERKGFKGLLTGRKGKKMLAGDDHELCYAVYLSGFKIWYDDRLEFKHFIPRDRMTKKYIVNLLKGFSRSTIVLGLYKRRINSKSLKEFSLKSSFIYTLALAIRWKIKTILKCGFQFIFKPEMRLIIIYSDFYSFFFLCLNLLYHNQARKKIKQTWTYTDLSS